MRSNAVESIPRSVCSSTRTWRSISSGPLFDSVIASRTMPRYRASIRSFTTRDGTATVISSVVRSIATSSRKVVFQTTSETCARMRSEHVSHNWSAVSTFVHSTLFPQHAPQMWTALDLLPSRVAQPRANRVWITPRNVGIARDSPTTNATLARKLLDGESGEMVGTRTRAAVTLAGSLSARGARVSHPDSHGM